MRSLFITTAVIAAALGAAACEKQTEVAQRDPGVCYSLGQKPDGTLVYNSVKTGLTQIEECAAALEVMRINYIRAGSTTRETLGAFQGKFVFVMRDGIYWGDTLEGSRFYGLMRTDDGRLVMPGAAVQAQ